MYTNIMECVRRADYIYKTIEITNILPLEVSQLYKHYYNYIKTNAIYLPFYGEQLYIIHLSPKETMI